MKSLFVMLALAGCALGQTGSTPVSELVKQMDACRECTGAWSSPRTANVIFGIESCKDFVKMGSSTRAIKDVFPEECGVKNPTQSMVDERCGRNARIVNEEFRLGRRVGIDAKDTVAWLRPYLADCLPVDVFIQSGGYEAAIGLKAGEVIEVAPEPEDVPAIQEPPSQELREFRKTTLQHIDDSAIIHYNKRDQLKAWAERCQTDTCADKSRILETAEDGTKWCRKPQTK